MTPHCMLLLLTLCTASRPVRALFAVQATAGSVDWIQTRQFVDDPRWREGNPLARPFVHSDATLVPAAAAEVFGCAWIAEKMRHSRHKLLRRTWWVWQGMPVVLHVWAIEHNARTKAP